jgi:hypothetical protein
VAAGSICDHDAVFRFALPLLTAVAFVGCLTEFPSQGHYRCARDEDCAGANVCRDVGGGNRLCVPPDDPCAAGGCVDAAGPRVAPDDVPSDPGAPPRDAERPTRHDAAPRDAGPGDALPPEGACPEGWYQAEGIDLYACGEVASRMCRYEFATALGVVSTCRAVCESFQQTCARAADDHPVLTCRPVPLDDIDCNTAADSLVCDCAP